jgi:hypothetical protein
MADAALQPRDSRARLRRRRRDAELDDDPDRASCGRGAYRGVDLLSKSVTHEYTVGEKLQNQQGAADKM